MDEKIIWILWMQGKKNMPDVVKLCYHSWIKHNPDYKIVFLDKNNIDEYLTIDPRIKNNPNITIQKIANIIRLNLLAKYGGVWADATCFCVKPLNTWIDQYIKSGFFAFERPGPDRMISNWFLVAKKDNILVQNLNQVHNNYWIENPKMKIYDPENANILIRSNKVQQFLYERPTYWLSFFITKILKVYPYFCFHFMFQKTYESDEQFKKVWDQTPKIPVRIPHALMLCNINNTITKELMAEIKNQSSPVYKLTHKIDLNTDENSVFNYLKSNFPWPSLKE